MPLLFWAGSAIAGFGLFAGSQIDDAIEKPQGLPIDAGQYKKPLPIYQQVILVTLVGGAVYYFIRKAK